MWWWISGLSHEVTASADAADVKLHRLIYCAGTVIYATCNSQHRCGVCAALQRHMSIEARAYCTFRECTVPLS